jgi:hypothetical protein
VNRWVFRYGTGRSPLNKYATGGKAVPLHDLQPGKRHE